MSPGPTVGDLIRVQPVRTVVQLADLQDPALSAELLDGFVVTAEVGRALRAVFAALARPRGSGFFLQGSFGAGKSHLLAALARVLEDPSRAAALCEAAGASPPESAYLVIAVSLVEHRSEGRLEDAVARAVAACARERLGARLWPAVGADLLAEIHARIRKEYSRELREFLTTPEAGGIEESAFFTATTMAPLALFVERYRLPYRLRFDRAEFWAELSRALAAQGREFRAVLLIDELSEFLRAKPSAQAFSEDVRFLQFLGEAGERLPLWVVASLQEWIEETGEIRQETFNKIKDRFPARLSLSGSHLGELVRRKLAPKAAGSAEALDRLHGELRGALDGFEVGREEFRALYPIHPATLSLLEDLRALLSQHRGAVDFICAQIAGDPRRGIPGILAEPAATLITPDRIFDHFQDRLRETLEYQPYLEVVFRYWRGELQRVFPDPAERALAERALKVLILAAIAPVERNYSVRRLAAMLLHRITSIDARANAEHLHDLLGRMERDGAYLGRTGAKDRLDDVFRVRLEADVNVLITKKLKTAEADVLAEGPGLLRRLKTLLTDPALPLAGFAEGELVEEEVRWQNTTRRGYFLFGDPTELGVDRIRDVVPPLRDGEPDFLFVLVPPWAARGTREWISAEMAPLLDDSTALGTRFWVPAAPEDLTPVASAAARALLLERTRSTGGPQEKSMTERLKAQLEADGGRVREFVRELYLKGDLFPARGQDPILPERLALQNFKTAREQIVARALEARFPAHREIAPRTDAALLPRLDALIEGFLRGSPLPRAAPRIDQMLVQGYLAPLGLSRQSAEGLVLHADPQRSEPMKKLLDLLGEAPEPIEALSRRFRKGRYGMGLDQFRLLLLAGAFSGQLRLYGEKRVLALEEFRAAHLARIRAVGRGEILGEREREQIRSLFFLDEKLRSKTFSHPLQEKLWEEVKEFRRRTEGELSELETLLSRYGDFPALRQAGFDAVGLRERSGRLGTALREIKLSYGAREGLEAFLRRIREEPFFEETYFDVQDALGFLRGPVDAFLHASGYARAAAEVLAGAAGPWQPAARSLDELRASLAAGPPHRAENRARREGAFEAFLGHYLPVYRSEHDRDRSPARFHPYRALRQQSRAFRLLNLLAGAERLSAANELVALHRRLESVLSGECAALSVEGLRMKALCDCGFRPRAPAENGETLPSTASLLAEAEAALARVLAEVASPAVRERIASHSSALKAVGDEEGAAELSKLAEAAARGISGDQEAAALETALDKRLVRALRDALGGRVVSVDRSLPDLAERIAGRAFPRKKLLAAVEDWIRGSADPGEEVLIRVTGEGAGTAAAGGSGAEAVPPLAAFLRDHHPELAGPRASGRVPPEALAIILWLEELGVPGEIASALPGVELPAPAEWEKLRVLATELRGADPAAFAECARLAQAALLAEEDWGGIAARLKLKGPESAAELLGRSRIFAGFQDHLARQIADSIQRGDRIPVKAREIGPDEFPAAAPLRELASLETARRALSAREPPRDPQGFEEALRGELGEAIYRLQLLGGLCAERGVDLGVAKAEALCRGEIGRWQEAFEALLSAGDPGEVLRIDRLEESWARRIIDAFKPREVLRVLVDGLRFDVWRYLRERFLTELRGSYRMVEEALLWAYLPTSTETQLERLRDPLKRGELVSMVEVVSREEYLRRRSGGGGAADAAGLIAKLDFIDHKVHTFRESMYEFYREARIGMEIHLQGLLEALPERSLVILFADHGFIEDPNFSPTRRYESPRYRHGGNHFLEVLAPAAAIYKAGGRR
jgi:hypothetical protein